MKKSLNDLADGYRSLGISSLSVMEEQYVLFRAQGLNPIAAARSAGYKKPSIAVAELGLREDVVMALSYVREMSRAQAFKEIEHVEFTKNDATVLYLQAHAKSATAAEEIRAVDSLVKLHGLAEPEKKQLEITTVKQMQELTDEELLELSNTDLVLDPADYKAKNG